MCMGRFFVGEQTLFKDQDAARKIFDGLVIIDATHRYDRMGTEYMAIGDVFDEKPEGEEAPVYDVSFDQEGRRQFTRLDGFG